MRRFLILVTVAACGGGESGSAPDAGSVDARAECARTPMADGVRKIVVSHPFTTDGDVYQVLDLATDGAISDPGITFTMGRSNIGQIAFTPDGEIGLVAQDDGSIGVFRFDESGAPEVLHAALTGDFYAAAIVMDPDGSTAYVVDTQWRKNGGGVYRLAIGCDDTVTDEGLWFPSKLPAGLALRGDRLLLAGTDIDGSTAGDDVHSLDRNVDPPRRAAGADVFPDEAWIVGGAAISNDQQYYLFGDNQGIADMDNRVAVVGIANDGDTLTPAQTIAPLLDPLVIVPSPFGDVVLVVSGFGDAVFVLDQTATDPPFTLRGEMTYQGASPQLPGGAVLVGDLVIVAENLGVRRIRLEGGGTVTDLGLTALGAGSDAITGAIGVQP